MYTLVICIGVNRMGVGCVVVLLQSGREKQSFFNRLVEDDSQTTLATVLTILVSGHEHTGTAFLARAFLTQTGDFSILVDL